jgi:hypothetical protein
MKTIKLLTTLLLSFIVSFLHAENAYDVKEHYSFKKVKTGDGKVYNLHEFKSKAKLNNSFAIELTPAAFQKHPDFMKITHEYYPDAVELVHEKTLYESRYLKDNGTTILVTSSEKPINYYDFKAGFYRAISNEISKELHTDGSYKAANQPVVKSIYPKTGKLAFDLPNGQYAYNQNVKLISESFSGTINKTLNRKQDAHKVGENGYFVKNAWEGIDMQAIFLSDGPIKTNYIINSKNQILDFSDYVIFEETINVPTGSILKYDSESEVNGVFYGDLILVDNNNVELLRYNQPFIYDHNYAKEYVKGQEMAMSNAENALVAQSLQSTSFLEGAFKIIKKTNNSYAVQIVVSNNWLKSAERTYPVVIDPITVNSTVIADLGTNSPGGNGAGCVVQVNSGPNQTYFDASAAIRTNYCHNITATLPAGYMLIGTTPQISVTSGYSSPSCARSNTFMQYYGPCGRDPRATGFYWFCNSNFAGNCGGNFVNPQDIVSRCGLTLTENTCATPSTPICTDRTITISTCIQTRCGGTGASNGNCHPTVRAWGEMRATFQLERILLTTIASSVGVNLCPNAPTTLSATGSFGVPNGFDATVAACTTGNTMGGTYTSTWTQISGPAAITLPAAGNTTTTGLSSNSFTMPATTGTYVLQLQICGACPALGTALNCASRQITLTVGQAIAPIVPDTILQCPGASTTVAITNPIGGYTYTWSCLGSPTCTSGTGVTRPIAGAADGITRTVLVQATAPCPSSFDTLRIVYGTPAAPASAVPQASPICPNTSTNLFGTCSNCRWYNVASGGTSLGSNSTYNTGNIASAGTYTYYVAEAGASGTCESARIPVQITVGNLSVTNVPTVDGTCSSASISTSLAGGTTTLNQTFNTTTTLPVAIPSNQTCPDPGDATACPSSSYGQADLTVPGSFLPTVIDANTIQSVCVTIGCGRGNEITAYLRSPDGTIITLISALGNNVNNANYDQGTCFVPFTTNTLPNNNVKNNDPAGYSPRAGALENQFVGETTAGTWSLIVVDSRGGGGCNSPTITGFSMTLQSTAQPTYTWTAVAPASTANLSGTTVPDPNWTNPNTASSYTYNVAVTDVAGCTGIGTVVIDCPLSVSWLDFKAKAESKKVQLKWITASEKDNDYFVVERSRDGFEFFDLDRIKAVGNSNSQQVYNYTDLEPIQGISYYRIRQVDKDGTVSFSKVESVNMGNKLFTVTASPNPTNASIKVNLNSTITNETSVISLKDLLGRTVIEREISVTEGDNTFDMDLSKLPQGNYVLETIVGEKREMLKITKEDR